MQRLLSPLYTLRSMLPASTSTLCVLPLHTNGRSHFSLDIEPMPAALVGRLAEPEYQAIIQRVNQAVQPLTHFGLTSLLFPFLAVDVLAVALLYGLDPAALVAPTAYDLPDMLLPMLLELALLLLAFPMVSFFVARRVEAVQMAAKAVLDDAARKYAARGVHFSLKLGMNAAGAASNMWMETQVRGWASTRRRPTWPPVFAHWCSPTPTPPFSLAHLRCVRLPTGGASVPRPDPGAGADPGPYPPAVRSPRGARAAAIATAQRQGQRQGCGAAHAHAGQRRPATHAVLDAAAVSLDAGGVGCRRCHGAEYRWGIRRCGQLERRGCGRGRAA